MSVVNFTNFIKQMFTEDREAAMQATTEDGKSLAQAFSELNNVRGEEKLKGAVKKLAAFAKHKGFDVSEGDVQQYIDSLKIQYEINPMVASMMDMYCASSCHIGSQINAS